jgi:hypothetical protein
MNRTFRAATTAAVIAAAFSAAAFAQTAPKVTPASAPQPAAPRPAAMSALTAPDKGEFRILLGGVEVGTEQFEVAESGAARIVRSETVFRAPGQPESRSTGELHLAADGTPLGYKWSAQTDKKASGVVEFTDGTAKTGIMIGAPLAIAQAVLAGPAAQAVKASSTASLAVGNHVQVDVGGSQEVVAVTAVTPTSFSAIFSKNHAANAQVIRPYEQDFIFPSPRVAVLDNNLYSQYALLAQLYDWNAKGQQTIPVLIPQDMTPGTIAVESLGQKSVEGQTFESLRVKTADVEILAYYDSRRRLMRVEVPAATVAIVRR